MEFKMPHKMNCLQYVLHNDHVFGLCFAKDGPPHVKGGGRCGSTATAKLSIMKRLFLFFLALGAAFLVSVLTYLKYLGSIGGWITLFFLGFTISHHVRHFIALPGYERAAVAWAVFIIITVTGPFLAIRDHFVSPTEFDILLQEFAFNFLVSWTSSMGFLTFKFMFCSVCCPCCIPSDEDFNGRFSQGFLDEPNKREAHLEKEDADWENVDKEKQLADDGEEKTESGWCVW
eukprot:TRINITY_DN22434_c0_g1_i1.p1 TRINITY_DN22434_c0_g1~~TRINITY_DN22434_c0_g1_i1.p1  ORF type:complete len:231 (-),score=51.49 TRINITY_DN22434_c0_g1_i1:41-733(-)